MRHLRALLPLGLLAARGAAQLEDSEVGALLEAALRRPEVDGMVKAYRGAWSAAGLPAETIDAEWLGPVFVDSAEEPLLSEEERERASDPARYQLVWLDPASAGLAIETFADGEFGLVEAKLASLGPDEFGEGGGVIFKGGKTVSEKLFLKYMLKEDYGEFLQRATEPPAATGGPDEEAKLEAAVTSLSEKLSEMTRLAPQIAKLLEEYTGRGKDAPVLIHGRPSPALVEFARIFPQHVRLGAPAPALLRV